jgi:uncharacterized protein with ParB-like and HNH nuclease domain
MQDALILKPIKDLLGEAFYIPHYQRGYRWTAQQVNDLLNDLWTFINDRNNVKGAFYCLQPIVVKNMSWEENGTTVEGWEVIDGQQRLTTIYIILYYLTKEFLKVESLVEDYGREVYSMRYQTRSKSEAFLKNIVGDRSNIDFHHIWEAYKTIRLWFANNQYTKDRNDRNKFLGTLLGKIDDDISVQVIWYHVEPSLNSIELFNRLNLGKIPLTNAELIKALFLSSSNQTGEQAIARRIEISQIWDEIEQKLNEPDLHFWSFVSNEDRDKYATKIDLIFDLVSSRKKDTKEPLHTFLYFLNKSKETKGSPNNDILWKEWLAIEQYFQTLCQWHKDKTLYHKIGYLISIGHNLGDLIVLSLDELKTNFEKKLDDKIRQSIEFDVDIEDLSYDRNRKDIENLLLLFNIESIRINDHSTDFYPFKFHKKTFWSLEHIHAQKSDFSKTKKEEWLSWLGYHEALVAEMCQNKSADLPLAEWEKLWNEIKQIDKEKLTWEKFDALSGRVIDQFSDGSERAYNSHAISNLALLGQPENSALNNAVFELKRRLIIDMDKKGNYIPICTRRVFLKYYNDQESKHQLLFWSADDRLNYISEIKNILKKYLPTTNKEN